MPAGPFDRIGLVVHPKRSLDNALATVHEWAGRQGAEVVQVGTPGQEREVAPPGAVEDCDVVLSLGGADKQFDARREAPPAGRPVIGVACGSLAALTAVTADRLAEALDRVAGGTWTARTVPGLVAEREGE